MLYLLVVGFVLTSCEHAVKDAKSKEIDFIDDANVIAEVSNGVAKILENNSSYSNDVIDVMLECTIKDSNLTEGTIKLKLNSDSAREVYDENASCEDMGLDCNYRLVYYEEWEHNHWVGWITWKSCKVKSYRYRCTLCQHTYEAETHKYY